MEPQYEYYIEEVTGLPWATVQSKVNLWPSDVRLLCPNVHLRQMLDQLKLQASQVYLIRWTGNKVPRGAKLGEHTIGYTQHGLVMSPDTVRIGRCNRIVESGGESGKEQVLLVYI
jgi:hypothetical protein